MTITPYDAGYIFAQTVIYSVLFSIALFVLSAILPQKEKKTKSNKKVQTVPSNQKKINIVVTAVVLAFILSFFRYTTKSTPKKDNKSEYVQGFLESCLKEYKQEEFCHCAADKISSSVSSEEIDQLVVQLQASGNVNKIPESVVNSVKECATEHPLSQ